VSGSILSNVLSIELKDKLSPSLIAQLASSVFALKDLNLSEESKQLISNSYMSGIHKVFLFNSALIAVHLCACLLIEDYGLTANKKVRGEERAQNGDVN
jgi:hypothetical protein